MGGLPFFQSRTRRKLAEQKKSEEAKQAKLRAQRDEWKEIARKVRANAAHRYIKGTGIEIGGLHRPLKVYNDAIVKYVDRLSTEEVQKAYPDVAHLPQVRVDIVDDGETLRTIADASMDFVIANHMLEHTRNPIAAVENFLRVLKPDGILYMAIPDKRFTFDLNRAVTPWEHLKRDYLEGPDWSDRQHYEDWMTIAADLDETQRQERVERHMKDNANIHFHVWTQCEIIEMILNMKREFRFPIEIETVTKNGHEVIVVLRKANLA